MPSPTSPSPPDASPITGARLCVFASGSCGNCSILEITRATGATRILIDLGLSPRATNRHLERVGLSLDAIDAAVLTHLDHDHCSPAWGKGLPGRVKVHLHAAHASEELGHRFAGHQIAPFETRFALDCGLAISPHVAAHDDLGSIVYRFHLGGFGDLGFATDIGRANSDVIDHLYGVSLLAIESNYCPTLQANSGRPRILRNRITSGAGHLSNAQALRAVKHIEPSQHVVLLHLSRDCNEPAIVAAMHRHARYQLTIASQHEPTPWLSLRPCASAITTRPQQGLLWAM